MDEKDIALYKKFQQSPIFFVEKMWRLTPQSLKEEFKAQCFELIDTGRLQEIKAEWFEPFVKGRHLTWQQWLFFLVIERAIQGKAMRKISICSGNGVGKSASLAILILWFLFCFKNAQVPCTAPTSDQIHDVLWKEIKIWLDKMPSQISALYDHTTGYLRIKEFPETWFARARTAKKESPEALLGVHSPFVLICVDEASGVAEEVYSAAETSMTGENVLVVLISNPTRLIGYFYDTQHKFKKNWQCLQFNGEESPIVERNFVDEIIQKYGIDSDEYKIKVQGTFPSEDTVDDMGFTQLIPRESIRQIRFIGFVGKRWMGDDPSGEGGDETRWVVRDNYKAKIVGKEKVDSPKANSQKTLTLLEIYQVKDFNTYVDNFGNGANVAQELVIGKALVNAVNWGEKCGSQEDNDRYENMRAKCYFNLREWLSKGGELVADSDWEEELTSIRYCRNRRGKLQIMSKEQMRKLGVKSPNSADALALTFYESVGEYTHNHEPIIMSSEQSSSSEEDKFVLYEAI